MATIGGGQNNTNTGSFSTVGGGDHNTAVGSDTTIGGGSANTRRQRLFEQWVAARLITPTPSADGRRRHFQLPAPMRATVSGGYNSLATGPGSFVGGGGYDGNMPFPDIARRQQGSVVTGGLRNQATNSYATVSGGTNNLAGGLFSTVGGGVNNSATGGQSTIPGGDSNVASGPHSTAIGWGANSTGQGSIAMGTFSAPAAVLPWPWVITPWPVAVRAKAVDGTIQVASGQFIWRRDNAQATDNGAFAPGPDSTGNTITSTNANSVTMRAWAAIGFSPKATPAPALRSAKRNGVVPPFPTRTPRKISRPTMARKFLTLLQACRLRNGIINGRATTTPNIGPMAQAFKARLIPAATTKASLRWNSTAWNWPPFRV